VLFEAGDNRKAVAILDFKDWAAKQVLLMVRGMKILGTLKKNFKKKKRKCCWRFKLD
jgi:hypothetical protein